MLYRAISKLLQGTRIRIDEFYSNPFIQSLHRGGSRQASRPSYIPATAFSNALLSTLWQSCTKHDPSLPPAEPERTTLAIVAFLRRPTGAHPCCGAVDPCSGVGTPGSDTLRIVVDTAVATQGPSIQAVRLAIEKWYNDSMDRLSGVYKRRTHSSCSCWESAPRSPATSTPVESLNGSGAEMLPGRRSLRPRWRFLRTRRHRLVTRTAIRRRP